MAEALLENISSANWQLSAQQKGTIVQGVDEIAQQIDLCLSTAIGSDPLRPLFGCDFRPFLDEPINQALPSVVNAIIRAAERWLPDVEIVRITAAPDVSTLAFRVDWKTNLAEGQNIVIYQ